MALTTPLPDPVHAVDPRGRAAVLDVVVPVYNEENDLEPCVRRLHEYLSDRFPYSFRITIADNASTDTTFAIACALQQEFPEIVTMHLQQKGRGRALHAAWNGSDAVILAYVDVDLSTDLAALLPLVAPLISGHSDLAIGSRLSRGSRVVRGTKREVISRCYNILLRGTLAARFSDAQCGFKAIRKDVADRLLPFVEDNEWFFDTELLVIAERAGLRIHEVPVDWIDDPDSRVDILSTALADLRGIARLVRSLRGGRVPLGALRGQLGRAPLAAGGRLGPFGQLVRFAGIGAICTVAYLLLYLLLRDPLGVQLANFLALLITAIGNTAANRRLTFGITGRDGAGRQQLQGLVAFGIGLGLTSGSLAVLHGAESAPSRATELTILVLSNLVATALRFALLRWWVFRPGNSDLDTGATQR